MKVFLCFGIALVSMGWILAQAPAGAQAGPADGQGGATLGNGDVNGDDGLDLSDAIYLLSHLFQGGPAPVACPGAAGAGGGPVVGLLLPDTEQVWCPDGDGDGSTDPADYPAACATSPCPGQDGFYSIGCELAGRFILDDGGTGDDGWFFQSGDCHHGIVTPVDDVVTDTCTGLMWQRAPSDVSGDGYNMDDRCESEGGGPSDSVDWCTALQYCEDLSFGGFDDWRMPNIRELLSITNVADRPAFYAYNNIPAGSTDPLFYPNGSATYSSTSRLDIVGPGQEPSHRTFSSEGDKGHITFGTANSKIAGSWVRAVRTVSPAGGGGAGRGTALRGQGGATLGNGDVNGDDSLDLSDAIYLLAHLFQGGPEPVLCPGTPLTETICDNNVDDDEDGTTDCADSDCAATSSCLETICDDFLDNDGDGDADCDDSDCIGQVGCPGPEICSNNLDDDEDGATDCMDQDCAQAVNCQVEGGTGLPDTGQTVCVDASGNVVPCDDPSCFGLQDGSFSTGCGNLNRFTVDDRGTSSDTSDDTVFDRCTGLTWQRDTANIPEDGDDQVEWCDALSYCENLTFAGESDWRLPNLIELESLVHYGFINPPAMDPVFGVVRIPPYWTSTTHDNRNSDNWIAAWYVSFDEGTTNTVLKTNSYFVRAVRGPGA